MLRFDSMIKKSLLEGEFVGKAYHNHNTAIRALTRFSIDRLRAVYDCSGVSDSNFDEAIKYPLGPLLFAFDGFLKNKVILDLGCGADPSNYKDTLGESARYKPWLCRALHELDARPIGIDKGNLSDEKFEGHSLDLTVQGALDFLPDNSVDAAISRLLFCATSLSEPQMEKMIEPQLERIIKPGGYFIYL